MNDIETDASQHLDELLRAWPESVEFSAHDFLQHFPALNERRSAVVAVAVEDYLRRRKTAHDVDLQSFAAGFGDVQASVVRAAEVMDYFLDHRLAVDECEAENWPVVGDKLLQFELLEELGGGLLSRVFVARDESIANRLVVVKLTHNSDREVLALGRLSHPGITPILSVVEDSVRGLTVVVMPFLSRCTLSDMIGLCADREGSSDNGVRLDAVARTIDERNSCSPCPLRAPPVSPVRPAKTSVEWIARIGAELADALDAAHRQGILHCDIKPSNIVLVDQSRPMLVDFNLCLGDDARRIAVGGTIPYMSQEQLCSLPLDARADIFSLAATLYHALTGVPPFGGPDLPLSQALSARMQGPSRTGAELHRLSESDPALALVLIRALAFEPEERFASSAAFAEALRACCSGPARLRRWSRRHRRWLVTAACAGGLFLSGWGVWQVNRDPYFVRATRAAMNASSADEFDNCVRLADSAIKANPEGAAAYVIRADARLRSGDLQSAYHDLKSAARLSQSNELDSLLTYVEYLLAKDDEAAIDAMERSVTQGLNEAEARNNMGYCYFIRKKVAAAVDELDRAISADPGFVPALLNRAAVDLWIHLQAKDRPNTAYVDKAVELSPRSMDVRRIAAEVYIQDVSAGGNSAVNMKRHCAVAVQLGVPANELEASLRRVTSKLGGWSLRDAGKAGDGPATRTARFVSPCDAMRIAESLLEPAPDGRKQSTVADARSITD